MNISPQIFTLVALFGPIYLLMSIRSMQVRRAQRRQEQEVEIETPPFAPGPPATYSPLLRRFSLPAQAYLSEQRKLLIWTYGMMAYASLVTLGTGLLPESVNRYGLQQSLPERVWYSYLSGYSIAGIYLFFFSLLAAFNAIFSLVTSTSLVSRIRPVPLRVLFWGRVGGMYVALLSGVAAGALVSLLLLLLIYGPVWKHLFDAARIVVPNTQHLHAAVRVRGLPGVMYMTPEQSRHLMFLLRSSAPRLALALLAQCSLMFSFVVAAVALPQRLFGKMRIVLVVVALLLAQVALPLWPLAAQKARGLFLSPQLGHPPPYVALAFPAALSLLLLFVALSAVRRHEL